MWKKGVLASIVAGLLVSTAAYPLRAADYKHSGCSEAAKMRFPTITQHGSSSSAGVRTSGKSIRKAIPKAASKMPPAA
jgi:hypothetical protein